MYEHEVSFANGLADGAAAIAVDVFRGGALEVRHKADTTLVTQADTSVERMIRERVSQEFPGDRILGEEEGGSHDPEGRVWIVDPIDGTASFARGIQVWATMIALQVDGVGVLGLVSAPELGERYVAVRGRGTTCNGEPISVSRIDSMADSQLLLQEIDSLLAGPYAAPTRAMVQECWRTRGFGDFWGHMMVARGSAEIAMDPQLAIWDLAAPQVVLEEAGGRVSTFEGGPLGHDKSMLATNGELHDDVLARLSDRR
jgi:histidinol-phosphatase